MFARLPSDTSLEAMFDIEIASDDTDTSASTAAWTKIKCRKCNGGGKFIGWSGRAVGDCFTCKGTGFVIPTDSPNAAIDVSKIQVAFATAFGNGIKRPKLRLGSFTFSRAPDTGTNAGSIYVKEGEWYLGKVTDGCFYPFRERGSEREAKVIEAASSPDKAAEAYGRRTGSCSCCGRELTNKVSIDRGIGPICAEKYGW